MVMEGGKANKMRKEGWERKGGRFLETNLEPRAYGRRVVKAPGSPGPSVGPCVPNLPVAQSTTLRASSLRAGS